MRYEKSISKKLNSISKAAKSPSAKKRQNNAAGGVRPMNTLALL